MAERTYPDPRVTRFISERFVPVQFNVVENPGAQLRFRSFWTPCIMLQDVEGNEHRRSYGSLLPEQFLAELSLAHGLRFLHTGHFAKALELLEAATEFTAPNAFRHAENMYWLAVARYRVSGNAHDLDIGWDELIERYPDSDWTIRADL